MLTRWRCRRTTSDDVMALSGRAAVVVGWCGMRGTVTLAAALALPVNFPYRDLIFFTSFAVVLVTLVVQGMTLRPLLAWLDVRDDGSIEREVQHARAETLRAGLEAAKLCRGGESAELLRRRYELRLRRAEGEAPDDDDAEADRFVIRAATAAERQRLIDLREQGTIGDAAFQQVEQELDVRELDLLAVMED